MPDQMIDSNGRPINLGFIDTSSTQLLDGGSSSAATTAYSSPTAVLISAPESFHIAIGTAPTATTSTPYLPAGLYETAIKVGYKIAVIKSSAATNGAVWVTPYA